MSDWKELSKRYPQDNTLPARSIRLAALDRVLSDTMYDVLPYPFSMERSGANEYIPLAERRPVVRTGLCRTVVDDAVSLLFSEGHFPAIKAKHAKTTAALAALVKETGLNAIMIDAATRGSIGSVAIQVVVVDFAVSFVVMPTMHLTPTFGSSGEVIGLVERYKVKGRDLAEIGYPIAPDALKAAFWFQRVWGEQDETWFLPQEIAEAVDGKPMQIDVDRSVNHGLGFVPIVWIKNLPGGDKIDGACTFESAISNVIEADYLLSQAGRALKYGSDPTLVLKSAGSEPGPARVGGAAIALTMPPEGDAKLLEINGGAAAAVLEHVRYLRTLALEAMHGNRSDSDRVTAAQSGRAIELMHAGLINLADRMRASYGETGLLSLLRIVCAMSKLINGGILIDGKRVCGLDPTGLELRWPAYFPLTYLDVLNLSQGLATANEGGIISTETAATLYASAVGVDDAQPNGNASWPSVRRVPSLRHRSL